MPDRLFAFCQQTIINNMPCCFRLLDAFFDAFVLATYLFFCVVRHMLQASGRQDVLHSQFIAPQIDKLSLLFHASDPGPLRTDLSELTSPKRAPNKKTIVLQSACAEIVLGKWALLRHRKL